MQVPSLLVTMGSVEGLSFCEMFAPRDSPFGSTCCRNDVDPSTLNFNKDNLICLDH